MTRRVSVTAASALALATLPASPADAHGLAGRADLPIPDWLFSWGATLVLVASFAALAVLWPKPKLQNHPWRPLPGALSGVLTSRAVDVLCGVTGVALLGLVVYAGYAGSDIPTDNFAPNFVFIAFWLGLVPLSVLLGDVFRAFNPWRALGRASGALVARVAPGATEPLPYPARVGYWPAALGLLAFGWLELVAPSGNAPSTVATATLVYSAVTLLGMALYGTEAWASRGEAFSVYFGLFARLSIWERRDARLGIRPPLSGLPGWPAAPGAGAVSRPVRNPSPACARRPAPLECDIRPSLFHRADAGIRPLARGRSEWTGGTCVRR